jgi:hypothetical protein
VEPRPTSPNDTLEGGMNDLVWHKQVPLKVSIFAWRLIRDRLPIKTNLVRRGMLYAEFAECGVGCGLDESALHLFLQCDSFGPLWGHARSWIGVSGVDPNDICQHFFQLFKDAQIFPSASVVTLCLGGLE